MAEIYRVLPVPRDKVQRGRASHLDVLLTSAILFTLS